MCARHGATRRETGDNRKAKAEREVTWGWESPGGPECREPLAEQ